jgi:tryptophan 7-halogenase
MIQNILVLGAGSAGLIAAITLKRKIPQLNVRIVRSPEIGVIGVGEGTTPNFPRHLFDYLGISRKHFYQAAQPTWKIGIRFLWGPRGYFPYTFSPQLDTQLPDLPMPNGFYCEEEFQFADLPSALIGQGKVFARQPNGAPDIQGWHGFHIENKKLVETLEGAATLAGVEFIDAKVNGAERGAGGIAAVHLEDGRKLEADFFVDASGFRSELMHRALDEPFVSFDRSLFCDRAVIGGWARAGEPILPYTTAETMDAGWAWQIEHEHFINRGYVYSSQFISDEEADAEFRRKNPKVPSTRIVKFRSGRTRNAWIDNVVAIGNSNGFVEPLEATALMVVCSQSKAVAELLLCTRLSPTPTVRKLFNERTAAGWDEIRDFLALHYWANTANETPFWRHCREDTDVSHFQRVLDFYKENGPTGFARHVIPTDLASDFGVEGYLVHLVGNRVPYDSKYIPNDMEKKTWQRHLAEFTAQARAGLDVKEALAYIRHPQWQWHADVPAPAPAPT